MRFDLDALNQVAASAGTPLLLAVDSIDEDPRQPRVEFELEALRQLADTIAERGVRQPISVRTHPEQQGRWLLNFGARRLRAARLAGRTEIPAFVDETADSFDQVMENEQRENLQPLELALFVQRQLKTGMSQAEIARRLGKTRGYMTFVGALIEPPDWLLELYRAGRCKGLKELYDLRKLHEARPAAVREWLHGRKEVSRTDVEALKSFLVEPVESSPIELTSSLVSKPVPQVTTLPDLGVSHTLSPREVTTVKPSAATSRLIVLEAVHEGKRVTIDLTGIPDEDGFVFVLGPAGMKRVAAKAVDLQLVRAFCREEAAY